ncbi:MAG: electron transport protein [Bacillaceae bacterium G1]|nr:MAG: electron transport protein [Bacillaceae bacterium G1]
MKRRKWTLFLLRCFMAAFIGFTAAIIAFYVLEPEYAYMPPADNIRQSMEPESTTKADSHRTENTPQIQRLHEKPKRVANGENPPSQAEKYVYDVWGETVVRATPLSPREGAVPLDEKTFRLGREMFYKETFGNEVFLTDIMGMVDGALTVPNIVKAIIALRGQGTTNLRVELAKDVQIGDRRYKKGEKVDTGLDVPKGAWAPLGMPIKFSEGKIKVGVSCAACHATVDPQTKQVLEGVPNKDLNAGLLMALATNSAAYFTHADVKDLTPYVSDDARTVPTSDGLTAALPDPEKLEAAVDAVFAKWPPGNFDSTIDLESNPAQIPDSFTKGDHPYGWSGFAAAGPFHGLSAFSNNVHAQNSDSLGQAENSRALFGIDKEVYLGTVLQNAANPKYRYDPASGVRPSAFFEQVDPTPGVPGVNEMIKPPSFPNVNLLAPDGLFVSSPGYKAGEQVNAISAWQNTLVPAKPPLDSRKDQIEKGRDIFIQAQCHTCHAGEAYTNHRIIDAKTIGTEPSRAKALKKTETIFGETSIYPFDTPVPLPKNVPIVRVPTGHLDPEQLKLAFAHGDSDGGYKVKGLIGLYWTAPYLHDGGVAVGPNPEKDLGVPGTLQRGVEPDPFHSLRALVDRRLRQKVIAANRASKDLQAMHVAGIGHEFWVDEAAGFTKEDQENLIHFLLNLQYQD